MNKQKNEQSKDMVRVRHTAHRRRSVGMILLNTLLMVLAIGMTLALIVGLAVTWYLERNIEPVFEEGEDTFPVAAGASQLYYYQFDDRTARAGERIALPDGTLDGGMHVIPVTYGECPAELIDAFVAIEDQQFWGHHGVNWGRTATAALNYCLGYTRQFGASTITQQLVKNLSGKSDYSIHRKVQEMCWANDLENRCTKEEIMERYLNVINLSQGCYGVGAAAERFFGKTVGELTLAECAAIAGITNNPSYYDPVRFPEHTRARRDMILGVMLGEGYIDEAAYREAIATPLVLKEGAGRQKTPTYSWYVDMVMSDVVRDLCATYGYTREYANRLLWNGGLTIEVAIDPDIQSQVEVYFEDVTHFPRHKNGERAQAGMIVIHPATGDILAVVGAVGDKTGNRLQSHATDTLRPAASAIKPLSVYAPALERGEITWASVFDDVPVTYRGDGSRPWPKNANRIYRGLTDVRYAVSHSVNTVAVRVLREVGLRQSFDFLRDALGMTSLIEGRTLTDGRAVSDIGEAALALGQMNYGVTLRELTAGYTALANGGVYMAPHSYYRVVAPDGRVLLSNSSVGQRAVSEQNACIMTKLLEDVVTRGTAKGAQLLGGRVAVAGKTGTSSADCDRYFIGYTPEYLAGVWYGFDYPQPMTDMKSNPSVKIWHDVMSPIVSRDVKAGGAKTSFPLVPGVIKVSYCPDSGLRPTDACRADMRGDRTAEGYFIQGTEPRSYCDRHVLRLQTVEQNVTEEGTLPPEELRRVGLLRIKRNLPSKIYVADQRYAVS
jgi:penicillin-binding protein 1A